MKGVFDSAPITTTDYKEAEREVKSLIKNVDKSLAGSGGEWLVGKQISLADIFVFTSMIWPLQTVVDGGFRKGSKALTSWANVMVKLPQIVNLYGNVKFCEK